MKTRIVHTKIWKDTWFVRLSKDAKLLWFYLLTNDKINISGIYELDDREIVFDTSIDTSILPVLKKELYPKAVFHNGWVKITNVDKYNRYRNSNLNEKAFVREMSYLTPKDYKGLEIPNNYTSIDTSMHSTPIPLEIRNKKSEIRNHKQEIINNRDVISKKKSSWVFNIEKNVAKKVEDIPF